MTSKANQKNIDIKLLNITEATKDLKDMLRQIIIARINNTPEIYYGSVNLLSLRIQAMKLDVILGRAIMTNSIILIRAVIEKQDNIYNEIIELVFEDGENMDEGSYIEIMNMARDGRRTNERTLKHL